MEETAICILFPAIVAGYIASIACRMARRRSLRPRWRIVLISATVSAALFASIICHRQLFDWREGFDGKTPTIVTFVCSFVFALGPGIGLAALIVGLYRKSIDIFGGKFRQPTNEVTNATGNSSTNAVTNAPLTPTPPK